jgi:hypothetical protein
MQTHIGHTLFIIIALLILAGTSSFLVLGQTNLNPNVSDTAVAPAAVDATEVIADWRGGLHISQFFPDLDLTTADPAITKLLAGGPPKDGIPAVDEPQFEPISTFGRSDMIQAIVMQDAEQIKVYPYHILNFHEIINDIVNGQPVAITFCPLCGSAIVFDRTLPDGQVTTLGVSGALIESNMVMYDRATDSLWQQSTGQALAGSFVGERLGLVSFQLMTIGEVKRLYPDALVLSEDTGYERDYGRNPYSGYEDDEDWFIFAPSRLDTSLPPKEIMVVFRGANDTPIAAPWAAVQTEGETTEAVNGTTYTLAMTDGELAITDVAGNTYPFYFEMWFSFAVQHGDTGVVLSR